MGLVGGGYLVVGVAGPVLHLLAPVNLTIWHSRLGEGCLMTHISRNKYEGEGPSIYLDDPEGNMVELKGPAFDTSSA